MGDASALSVAQRAWDDWVAADLAGFLSLWQEDGVLTNAGHSPISGACHGPAEIGALAQTPRHSTSSQEKLPSAER